MIRIVTLSEGKNGIDGTARLQELTEQLGCAEVDVLCCQGMPRTLDGKNDPVGKIAELLQMTYSFSATSCETNAGKGYETTIRGLSILTGANVWMLSSGSFPLPGKDSRNKQVVQFAVIRQDFNAVLVINAELSPVPPVQLQQLQAIFSHQLLQEQYSAVVLCSNGNTAVSPRDVQSATLLSAYKLTDEVSDVASGRAQPSSAVSSWKSGIDGQLIDGVLFTLIARKMTPTTIKIHRSPMAFQPASGLATEFEFKRVSFEKSKFSFPLSFSEQRLEARDSFRGLAASML